MKGLARKFFIQINSSKIQIQRSDLKRYGYFSDGSQDHINAGKLYYRIVDCLIPVLDEKNKVIVSDQYFGKNVSETPFLG